MTDSEVKFCSPTQNNSRTVDPPHIPETFGAALPVKDQKMISGKALLVVHRDEDSYRGQRRYSAYPYLQSCTPGTDASRAAAFDDLMLELESDQAFYPRSLGVGDVARISIQFSISYSKDDLGEADCHVYFGKAKLLRTQRSWRTRKQRKVLKLREAASRRIV